MGEILVDAISTNMVTNLAQAKGFNMIAGGSAANFSRFLTRCNTEVKLVASVGNDGFGQFLLHALAEEGVSTQYIAQQNALPTSLIMVGKTTDTPDFIPYRGADKMIVDIDEVLINDASVIHATAFALSKQPAQASIMATFSKANSHNITISIDWNYSEKIWDNHQAAQQIFAEIQQFKPIFKFSTDDVNRYLKTNLAIEAQLAFLDTIQAKAICLTCGSKGVYFKTSSSDWQHTAAQPIEVKDATGAGDAFWAGFMSQWIAEKSINECVKKGIETASLQLTGNW